MWRRFWAWWTRPILTPDVIAVAEPPADSELADRIGSVELRLITFLDGQAAHWPEDRNDEATDLALDVARLLGIQLPAAPDRPPVAPGRSS